MSIVKTTGTAMMAVVAVVALAAPAIARPNPHAHQKQVCKMERHHGHATRVCHWVRR